MPKYFNNTPNFSFSPANCSGSQLTLYLHPILKTTDLLLLNLIYKSIPNCSQIIRMLYKSSY